MIWAHLVDIDDVRVSAKHKGRMQSNTCLWDIKGALYRAARREIADVPIDPPSLLGLGMFGLSRRWPTQAVLYSAALI